MLSLVIQPAEGARIAFIKLILFWKIFRFIEKLQVQRTHLHLLCNSFCTCIHILTCVYSSLEPFESKIFQNVFPKNKDIHLHNHSTTTKIRDFNLDTFCCTDLFVQNLVLLIVSYCLLQNFFPIMLHSIQSSCLFSFF